MKKFFKNRCVFGLIVVVIVLSVVIGVVNAVNSDVKFTENVFQVIITPVQGMLTKAGSGVSGFFGYFSNVDKLRNEVSRLEKENKELESELSKTEISIRENEELRKLLGLKESYPQLELEAAEIVARDPINWYNTFTINKGAVHGVAINQAVISVDKSLVGRICEVGTTWSKVMTINDPGHAVGAEVVRSGEYGIVEGDSTLEVDGNCRLSFVPKNANIIVGDKVVTSGLGGVYPKGLSVGKVLEIRPDVQGISQYAVISPDANIEKLKAVFIIKNDMDI